MRTDDAVLRPATPGDVPDLLRLVRSLADYERAPEAVDATEDDYRRVLFGETPTVFADVAEVGGRVVGMAVWFLEWAVLDWNAPALDFYRARGAVGMDEWTVQRLEGDALAAVAAQRA